MELNLNEAIAPTEDNQHEKLQEEEKELICAVFKNETGRIFLGEMRKKMDGPIYKPGLTLDQVAYRQGKLDFLKEIIKVIDNG